MDQGLKIVNSNLQLLICHIPIAIIPVEDVKNQRIPKEQENF